MNMYFVRNVVCWCIFYVIVLVDFVTGEALLEDTAVTECKLHACVLWDICVCKGRAFRLEGSQNMIWSVSRVAGNIFVKTRTRIHVHIYIYIYIIYIYTHTRMHTTYLLN
jgi:hypothetical protein